AAGAEPDAPGDEEVEEGAAVPPHAERTNRATSARLNGRPTGKLLYHSPSSDAGRGTYCFGRSPFPMTQPHFSIARCFHSGRGNCDSGNLSRHSHGRVASMTAREL